MKILTRDPWQSAWKKSIRFWSWVFCQYRNDKCTMRASSLTFTTLLAIVPLVVVVFSALSIFPFFSESASQIQDFIFNNMVPSTGEVIQKYVMDFEKTAHKLPVMGFIFLFVTAIMMMVTIENTLNDIWKVRYRRNLSGSLLLYWALLTLGPVFLSASVLLSSYIGSVELMGVKLSGFKSIVMLLPPLSAFIASIFLYLVVPRCKVKVRHAAAGALMCTILFELAKWLFGLYVTHFPTYSLLYGALATIPLFLLWLYVSWAVFLFGAQVVNGLRLNQAERSTSSMDQFYLAYRIVYELWLAQKEGRLMSLVRLVNRIPHARVLHIKETLRTLRKVRFIQMAGEDSYVLYSDLHELTLYRFYQALRVYLPENLKVSYASGDAPDQALEKILIGLAGDREKHLNVSMISLFSDAV